MSELTGQKCETSTKSEGKEEWEGETDLGLQRQRVEIDGIVFEIEHNVVVRRTLVVFLDEM